MQVNDICKKLINGENVKGLYLYGPFTEKVIYFRCHTKINSKLKVPSTIVYLPEYIRTLKGGFKDGVTKRKLQRIREANILMLDDIGAEEVTPWVRDEVIGPLLHYRMVHELPTFFF